MQTSPRPHNVHGEYARLFLNRALKQRDVHGRLFLFCGVCTLPLVPCPKGPGADEPGFVGFYPCCPGAHEDINVPA